MYVNLKLKFMKKMMVVFFLLFVCFSGFNQDKKKKSRKVRNLTEKIDAKLDSITRTPVFETIKGKEYYRFSHGVLNVVNDSILGVFILNERIHFTSHNGEIVFFEMDETTGRCYKKTLEQLLFTLEKEW